MFRDQGFRKSAPLEEGQEIDVTIEAVGEKGDGIAKSKGFVIFIPGVKQGDNVKIRITKVLRNFSFGEVVGAASAAPAEGKAPAKKRKSSDEESSEGSEGSSEDKDDFGGDDNDSEDNSDEDKSNEEFEE
ncbi:MAG: TRAM domain-containing protein [Nanoarchaeota archaeon]